MKKKLPPLETVLEEKATSNAEILDERIQLLEKTLEKCISKSDKNYQNYNFYYYYGYELNKQSISSTGISKFAPYWTSDTDLGYAFGKDIYINIQAFPRANPIQSAVNSEIFKLINPEKVSIEEKYQEYCMTILNQI